jgi:hypothetical protein
MGDDEGREDRRGEERFKGAVKTDTLLGLVYGMRIAA